jgi:hypothetical protein
VVYGLLAFVASLPGAGVLVVRWITRRRAEHARAELARTEHARLGPDLESAEVDRLLQPQVAA